MKITNRQSLVAGLGSLLVLLATALPSLAQQDRPRPPLRSNNPSSYRYAYEHGYRAGYEDGYEAGKHDFDGSQPRDFARSQDYQRADRTYESRMGELREYQDGYQAGFELAYNDGYFGRPYAVSIPTNLGQIVSGSSHAANRPRTNDDRRADDRRVNDDRRDDRRRDDRVNDSGRARSRDEVIIPDGTQVKVRLTSQISTKTNRQGDQFTAIVLDPSDLAEATITGHIAKINRSGRSTGKTEMALAFDSITTRDGRTGPFDAQVDRVYESETVKTVDEEGNVQTGSRTKDTATRTAGGAVLGAIIGGIAGGGKGAAIGAVIGGGVGAGSVYVQGDKDLILDPGTEMLLHVNAPDRNRR
ncbi:MAG TPA: hypothetical protein VFD58_16255 [Blastocatellia bacterium]|nr:hypothetical protein [Blastocatellia bacterium]